MSNTHDNTVEPAIMSRALAVRLGAKPIPFDKAGHPIALQPPRPTLIVMGCEDMSDARSKYMWLYWEIIPGAEQRGV